MKAVGLLVFTLSASLALADTSLRLHHRIWDPLLPPPSFSIRANLQLSPELGPILVLPQDSAELLLSSDHGKGTLYQIALEREGDLSETDWDLSSMKACHLVQAESDIINLHFSSPDKPYALDYFVYPIPHDGSCPKKTPPQTAISFTNTTLTFQFPASPPLPELRVPPPLSPKGEPIQPEPEKSFLEKYWMYIGLGLLTLVLTGGGAPDEDGQVQGRAGGRTGGH